MAQKTTIRAGMEKFEYGELMTQTSTQLAIVGGASFAKEAVAATHTPDQAILIAGVIGGASTTNGSQLQQSA